jgi:hypothetical protein
VASILPLPRSRNAPARIQGEGGPKGA